MYSQNTIPAAATGIVITGATFAFNGWALIFIFCAFFALIGAICAIKRTFPIPVFVKTARNNKRFKKLNQHSK